MKTSRKVRKKNVHEEIIKKMRKSGKSDDFSISTSASSNVTGKVTGQQQTST